MVGESTVLTGLVDGGRSTGSRQSAMINPMTNNGALSLPPDEEILGIFWEAARQKLASASWEDLFGPRLRSSLRPPAMQLADDAEEASDLARQIRDAGAMIVRSPAADFSEDSPAPEAGDLTIICDGGGVPLVLVRTKQVDRVGDEIVEELVSLYPTSGK